MYAVIELQPKFIFIKKIGRKFLVLEACCQEEKYFIKACYSRPLTVIFQMIANNEIMREDCKTTSTHIVKFVKICN
jgi:hypothetical protein